MPCHDAGDVEPMTPAQHAPTAASGCETGKALADTAKVPVPNLMDFPVALVSFGEPRVPALSAGAPVIVQAVCTSPPLRILQCRLLN